MSKGITAFAVLLWFVAVSTPAFAQQADRAAEQVPPPVYLQDRGTGLPTSMFGTYIKKGELVLYPFYEYYRDRNYEYAPIEFGVPGSTDFRGRYRAHEGIFLLAFGVSDRLAIEVEAAVIKATFNKAANDLSMLPPTLTESGIGDVEGQIRWRWNRESEDRPEVFSYTEVVVPHSKDKVLIGNGGWQVKFGTGLIRGFRWGTVTVRGAVEYTSDSSSRFDLGEYAVEYLKQVSPRFRLFAGVEGTQDELSAIVEGQWRVHRLAVIKANIGRGLTSRATDWAPEIGILFTLPGRRK